MKRITFFVGIFSMLVLFSCDDALETNLLEADAEIKEESPLSAKSPSNIKEFLLKSSYGKSLMKLGFTWGTENKLDAFDVEVASDCDDFPKRYACYFHYIFIFKNPKAVTVYESDKHGDLKFNKLYFPGFDNNEMSLKVLYDPYFGGFNDMSFMINAYDEIKDVNFQTLDPYGHLENHFTVSYDYSLGKLAKLSCDKFSTYYSITRVSEEKGEYLNSFLNFNPYVLGLVNAFVGLLDIPFDFPKSLKTSAPYLGLNILSLCFLTPTHYFPFISNYILENGNKSLSKYEMELEVTKSSKNERGVLYPTEFRQTIQGKEKISFNYEVAYE